MSSLNPRLVETATPPIPAAQRWKAAYDGRLGPAIDLAQAVPGWPPPQPLLDRLALAAAEGASAAYGPILGDEALRAALGGDLARVYGVPFAEAEVAITAGCNQAFFVAVMALAKAGDAVMLPAPWYFNHKMTLDMLGIEALPLPCRAEAGFVPAVEEARALLHSRVRAIVLVSPNNPTGATYPAAVLAAFQDLAREAGIALILDETYREFLPEGLGRPHDLFEGDWRSTTIQLFSFSKSYAIPGHRLGALVASRGTLGDIAKILDSMTICPPRVAQGPVAWAVEGTRDWREAMRATINRRAARFIDVMAQSPGWSISAIGAYFAYVRHPFGGTAERAAETLAARVGLVTLPGSFFGPGQEDHLRVAVANVDEAQIAAIGPRLAAL